MEELELFWCGVNCRHNTVHVCVVDGYRFARNHECNVTSPHIHGTRVDDEYKRSTFHFISSYDLCDSRQYYILYARKTSHIFWNRKHCVWCEVKWEKHTLLWYQMILAFLRLLFLLFFLFFHFFSYYNHCIINSEEALLLGASFHNWFFLLYVYFALFTQCETLIYDNLILHTFHIKTKWWKNKIECWLFVDENGRLHDI